MSLIGNFTNISLTNDMYAKSVRTLRVALFSDAWISTTTFLNLIACLATIYVLFGKNPYFKTRTFVMVKILLVNDGILSVIEVAVCAIHVYCSVTGTAQIVKKQTCFIWAGSVYYFIVVNCMIELIISMDRFLTLVKQTKEDLSFTRKYKLIMLLPFIITALIHAICLMDDFENITLLYCSGKVSVGRIMTVPLRVIRVGISLVTVFVYLLTMLYFKYKIVKTMTAMRSEDKSFHRITKILTYTTLFHFIIGPVNVTFFTYLLVYLPDQVAPYGNFVVFMSFLQSMLYFVSFLFVTEFRNDASKAFLGKVHQNQVTPSTQNAGSMAMSQLH